jgi:hypothetical protein
VADLDEISLMIGEIRSDMRHAVRWFDEHEKKDQERYDGIVARLDEAQIARSLVRMELIENEIKQTKPVIEGLKKAKWVLAGFIAAIGLVGGAVGSIATNALKWFS